ncbi:DUF308 domain-containing protein [uncultured Ruthenibacterium sp.]|uniref:DUF308 domain-containing protein n=1 Tax=uncultured Ruthenibacterium sp. TaxID=1905347 RepID=UPI00349EAB0B
MAVLYMALGLILLLFPEMTGTLFCWALAAACVALAVSRFARWRQASRRGYNASGELVVGVLFTALALFCVLGSRILLSFVPLVSGVLLLLDGAGKLPLALDAKRENSPSFAPLLVSAVVPLVLGIVMVVNPFGVTKLVIRFFGLSLLLDGVCDLGTALYTRSRE